MALELLVEERRFATQNLLKNGMDAVARAFTGHRLIFNEVRIRRHKIFGGVYSRGQSKFHAEWILNHR